MTKNDKKKKVKKDASKRTLSLETFPSTSSLPTVACTLPDEDDYDLYDEKDITTLLPDQPTLENVGDPDALRILEESRQGIVSIWNEIDSPEWTKSKEKNGASLYWRSCNTGVKFKRYMQVNSDIDTALNCFKSLEVTKKYNDRIEKIEAAKTLPNDCQIIHQLHKGNFFASARDF